MQGIFKGLQELISNFRSIIDFIKTAWTFFIHVIQSIGEFIGLLMNIFSIVYSIIATLPPWLIAFASLSVGVCILYLIVGREHGN